MMENKYSVTVQRRTEERTTIRLHVNGVFSGVISLKPDECQRFIDRIRPIKISEDAPDTAKA